VVDFLFYILQKTSARNRNNYRASLSSLFQNLKDNDIIPSNFISEIPILKSTPNRNKTYSDQQHESIFKYLEDNDPLLLLFIKFISYNFLRPIEVCRLTIGDIDLKNKRLSFKAKNSPLKVKIIPDILMKNMPDLSQMEKNNFLFTPNGIGFPWETALVNKRNYFSGRFRKIIKKQFGLGIDYGLYSFRHTFITKLYRELAKSSSPFSAKSQLMQITGHSSMSALEKYLRDIDAELPDDYSKLLEA
jgi:integrase